MSLLYQIQLHLIAVFAQIAHGALDLLAVIAGEDDDIQIALLVQAGKKCGKAERAHKAQLRQRRKQRFARRRAALRGDKGAVRAAAG